MKLNRLLGYFLLINIIIPFFSLSAGAHNDPANRRIIIYTDNQYSPFEFLNKEGMPDGFNVELMRAIMEEVNLDYEIKMADWPDVLRAFDEGRCDVIAGITNTPARATRMSFGIPHNQISLELILPKESEAKSLEDLRGKKVIVQKNDWGYEEVISRQLTDSVFEVSTIVEGVELMRTGKYDAYLSTDMVNHFALAQGRNYSLKVKKSDLEPRAYSLAVHKGDETLLYLMNKALYDLKVNGTYEALYDKWFNVYDIDRIPGKILCLIYALLIAGSVMSFFLFLMRRQIKKATAQLRESEQTLLEKNNQLNLSFSAGNTIPFIWEVESDLVTITFPKRRQEPGVFTPRHKELTLKELFENVHPDDFEKFTRVFTTIKTGETRWVHEEGRYNYRKSQHDYFDVYMTVERTDEKERPTRVIGYLQNITKRKLAEIKVKQNEQFLSEILDSIPFPVYVKDVKHNFTYRYWNKQSRIQYGEGLNKTAVELVGPERAAELHKSDLEVYNTGQVYSSRERFVTLTGHESNTIVQKSVINIDGERLVLIVRWSIDELLELQHHLEETNKVLEKAKDKAERSDRLKSAFLANMSHEIRTPLNAIVGFSQLMKYAQSEEEKENYDRVISFNNDLLLKLINDILDLAKIEAGYIDFKKVEFDLAQLIYELRDTCCVRLQPGVELLCDNDASPCVVSLDKERVAQVITNFITNAAKFTARGSIRIGYECTDSNVRIYVRDTGKGISEANQCKIFERFEKGDSFAQGTGLGLSICKSIAETAGGTVGVESHPGQGSTFWISLPLEGCEGGNTPKNDTEEEDEANSAPVCHKLFK